MLKMGNYEHIRRLSRVYGKSIHEISRETGHDRKTIRKALKKEYSGYTERENQPMPALGPFIGLIDKWLETDRNVNKKQRHTARRIYERLVDEEGFTGSESAVRAYVAVAKIRLGITFRGVFIPLEPECGLEAEVDWGTATAVIDGKKKQVKYFCMRSKFSGRHFIRVYENERQQAFFDAHIHAFEFFGGIFKTIIYDNLTAAVKKVLMGKTRIEQESFIKFRSYYSFDARYCNVASGNEKGGVEGVVGFARRKYMVPIPEFESIEAFNTDILRKCLAYGNHKISGRDKTVSELFEDEKPQLIRGPQAEFPNVSILNAKVNHYSTSIIDKNRYSVPCKYVGMNVHVQIGVDRVEIFHNSKKIAAHRRIFNVNGWQLDPDHYLDILQQRPAAFASARPIREWRKKWPEPLERLLGKFIKKSGDTAGTKEFITVLKLYRNNSAEDVAAAVDLALENGISDGAGVSHILLHHTQEEEQVVLKGWPETEPLDIAVFSFLNEAETNFGHQKIMGNMPELLHEGDLQ